MRAQTRTIPADIFTPIGAYSALAPSGAGCLLESVEGGGRISRYSFLGFDYVDTHTFESDERLLERMRAFVEPHRIAAPAGFPAGGALVAFAYDAARPFARLPAREGCAPLMPDAFVAIPATWLIFDHFNDTMTFWTCGNDAENLEARIDGYLERLMSAPPTLRGTFRLRGGVSQSLERAAYLELVRSVKSHIYEGDVYQLQLGIRFSAPFAGSAFDMYRALRSLNPSPYMFYVDGPFGQVLGASPEFLVRLDGRTARIRPLAGTRSRGRDDVQDAEIARELLSNEKERAEHVMLVDLGRNDLGAVCEYGSVAHTELMQIERYSHVMHIVSDLTGTLRPDADALDLFAAGFPAGTVTGTPKVRAMQLIDSLEPVARGFYAGSIGRWSYNGDFDSCITLRSMHVRDANVAWQASAGIVADSRAEDEYNEVLQKTGVARAVLGLESAPS
ncbi:MAG: anthranilate synthase component I family protein [Candidatus Eremiobacteraeota bacterium]|nr:anthranilate synthase component I family protein [Candidatus Eremiobacteraeota bacterium]